MGSFLAGNTLASAVRSCGGVVPYDVFFELGTTAEPVRINCSQSFLRCYETKQLSGPEAHPPRCLLA